MKNKLVYVQWTNGYGGLEKITQCLEERFAKYHPLIVPLRFSESGLRYKNCYILKKEKGVPFVLEYIIFVRQHKDCFFHLQYTGSLILLLTYIANPRSIAYHFHGTKFSATFFDKLIWKLIGSRIIIIVNSEYTKSIIDSKLRLNKPIQLIPNYIDTSKFVYSKREYVKGKFVVTYAGRFTEGKNINVLIEVVKEIVYKQENSNIEFRLYGDGPIKNELLQKVSSLSLERTIKIYPFTNNIRQVYNESHIFIFLSKYESFGNVVAEAILSGLPVLCFKIPSISEFVDDEFFFVEKLDPSIISDRIIYYMNNYGIVNDKLKEMYEHMAYYLNNDKIIDKLNNIYTLKNNM